MTAETFAANLRSEMGRQNISARRLEKALRELCADYIEETWWTPSELVAAGLNKHKGLIISRSDIAALAAALGCPVERLTVSREELEARLARLEAQNGTMAFVERVGGYVMVSHLQPFTCHPAELELLETQAKEQHERERFSDEVSAIARGLEGIATGLRQGSLPTLAMAAAIERAQAAMDTMESMAEVAR